MRIPTTTTELEKHFGIPDIAEVTEGNGGLAKISIHSATATAELYLHGGHVTAWKPEGAAEVLWVSEQAKWEDGKPIRGGVPVCFPWYGANQTLPNGPFHGFVNSKTWLLESIAQIADEVTVVVSTVDDEATKKWWPAAFELRQRITFGRSLTMNLELTNTGRKSILAQEALHTYFQTGDVRRASIHGLEGVRFMDAVDSVNEKTQRGTIMVTTETDRVYLNTPHETELHDPVLRRRIRIRTENSRTTAVWNPWIGKARSMPDFGDDEWQEMICIETCNVADFAVEVEPGQCHTMGVVVSVEPM